MKYSQLAASFVVSVMVALVTVYGVGGIALKEGTAPSTTSQAAFDRIMASNTLRCGYGTASPWFMVDPITKKMSGVSYDMTNAVAAKIGLKVDWVEETSWGVAEQGLITNRYDMMCGSVCVNPRRARAATFSTPFLHIPFMAVVRKDDKRFDNDPAALNNPDVRLGVKSDDMSEFIANEQFPLAKKVYANDLADTTEFFLMLNANKIDVAFTGQKTVDLYNEKNAAKVRSLAEPVKFCNGGFMMPLGDERLKHIIDNSIMELNTTGQIQEILGRYVPHDPRYVRAPALPYREK